MENILIPSTLFALIIALFGWKTRTFAPRRVKLRLQARYFETTSKVSREG